jgi:hypothetical protein
MDEIRQAKTNSEKNLLYAANPNIFTSSAIQAKDFAESLHGFIFIRVYSVSIRG